MKNNINNILVFTILSFSIVSYALADGGAAKMWYNAGGNWSIEDVNDAGDVIPVTQYQAVVACQYYSWTFYCAKVGGGIDRVWWGGTTAGWNVLPLSMAVADANEYIDLAVSVVYTGPQFYALQASGGGIYKFDYNGGTEKWQRSLVDGSVGKVYNAIALDGNYNYRLYATKPTGGMDTYWLSGGWNTQECTYLDGYIYNDISECKGVGYTLYGARQGGGVDKILHGSSTKATFGIDGNPEYIKIQADYTRNTWAYGCKPDGGIDWLFGDDSGGVAGGLVPIELSDTQGIKYAGVASRNTGIGYGFAIKGLSPKTCSEMRATGSILPADVYPDCVIDLLDFSVVAGQWLNCNDPNTLNCP